MTDSTQTSEADSWPDPSLDEGALENAQSPILEGEQAERVGLIADDVEALVHLDPAAAADGAVAVVDALARLLEEEDR